MENPAWAAEGNLRREAPGAFFAPTRPRSTCSGFVGTESSMSFGDSDEEQHNSRRITICKQVLLEATAKFSAAPLVDMTLMKNVACRNSGALGPLLSMLLLEQETINMVRCLETLSFLLLDRSNRRACHELGGLDVLLDILRRATDQQVLLCAVGALCSLCKHDVNDKMALWRHKKKGYLLSMLNTRLGSTIVVETLRTCRSLCFAVCGSSGGTNPPVLTRHSSSSGVPAYPEDAGRGGRGSDSRCCRSSSSTVPPQPCGSDGGTAIATSTDPIPIRRSHSRHPLPSHHPRQHPEQNEVPQLQTRGTMQLLEPSLLGVVSGLLHPAADPAVMRKVLKLLIAASGVAVCALNLLQSPAPASSITCASDGSAGSSSMGSSPNCCGCWRNPVFQLVPLLTHCADINVVENALAVLVNLSENPAFHRLLDASGCVSPLLHLLSHKRCVISQYASCVLSALAEGGLARVKLCQDTALLAMLRVLQANHCVVVTMGVLYMLGRLAAYRSSVVRSLKGWGAVPLLNRLLSITRDQDAVEGCRQLLQLLGATTSPPMPPSVTPQGHQEPRVAAVAVAPVLVNPLAATGASAPKLHLKNAHSSSSVCVDGGGFLGSSSGVLRPLGNGSVLTGAGSLVRTISAVETVAAMAAEVASCAEGKPSELTTLRVPSLGSPLAVVAGCGSRSIAAAVVAVRPQQLNTGSSSFRFVAGSGSRTPAAYRLFGSMAIATAAAAY